METLHIEASRIKILMNVLYFSPFAILFLVLLVLGTGGLARMTVTEFRIVFIAIWLVLLGLWFIELVLINSCLLMLINLFAPQPRLTLDRLGVEDRWLGVGAVDWVDIERIQLVGYRGIAGIGLCVTNRQKYVNRMSRWTRLTDRIMNPWGGGGILSIHYGCFKGRPSKIHEAIVKYRKARLHGVH